jgi:hypothetical protein
MVMKRITQKEMILNFLRSQERWFSSYELRGKPTSWGFLGHQGDRRARELAKEGKIEVRHKGAYAEYHAFPPLSIEVYSVGGAEVYRKVNY